MADNSYGLHLAADLIAGQTVAGMDVEKLSQEQLRDYVDARLETRNAAISLILGSLALPTTNRGALIGQQSDLGEWPKATELDRGRRRKTEGLTAVGFPIYKFGPVRSGWSFDYLAKASNTEILMFMDSVMAGHMQANYNEAMRALFRNTDITWTDDLFKEDGSVTVKPLVNGDGSFIPPEWRGNTFTGSHTHFVTTGGATLDEADLQALADHLREHGYGVDPSVGGFGGQIVVWINNAQVADVQGHTNFVAANDPIVVNINKIYAGGVNQDRYLGYNSAARVWLREVPYVPASYYVGMVTTETGDSPRNGFAPLRRRIPTTAALQGIRRFEGTDYPLQESWWQDFFGFGVYNRISAVVGKVTAGAYDIPTIG